jgi:ketosteroid isomerase-like protein
MDLTVLSDRAAIHDVLMRYCRGVDRADMTLVRRCFHDDARIDFPDDVYVGTPDGFCDFLTKDLSLMARSKHEVRSMNVEIDGDTAYVEAYLTGSIEGTEYHRWQGAFVTVSGRYIDRFEKRAGVWKIAHHTLVLDWQRKDQVGGWFKLPEAQLGARDGTDLAVRATSSTD